MKRSKEELGRIHKEKCKELKQIRARIAEDLGIDLQQKECTYEGYCSGTCPKCKSEEMRLNLAIMKRQMEETDVKRRVVAAGLTTVAALSLTGCNIEMATEGAMEAPPAIEQLEGDVAFPESFEETLPMSTQDERVLESEVILEGGIACTGEPTWEIQGEVPEMEEEIQ